MTIAGLALVFGLAAGAAPAQAADAGSNPNVRLTTSLGVIELELYPDKAPETVRNFLAHLDKGFYNGTLFHRVIKGFMIQGGGYEPGMKHKTVGLPIRNEATNGLKNKAGTIAMARTMEPHSASAQFFINTVDNAFLDHRDQSLEGWGYCVFGRVTQGMDVVKKIEAVATDNHGGFQNVPKTEVVIRKAERIRAAAK